MLSRAAPYASMAPTCIASLCYILFPILYGVYQFTAAHFISAYLPTLPDAALSCLFYASFSTAMGFLGTFGFLLRSPWLLLIFAHHLLLDAFVSVIPSVMLLDLFRRSLADICDGGDPSWCEYGSAGAAIGFGLGAVAIIVVRICVALATRQAALGLEAQELERETTRRHYAHEKDYGHERGWPPSE